MDEVAALVAVDDEEAVAPRGCLDGVSPGVLLGLTGELLLLLLLALSAPPVDFSEVVLAFVGTGVLVEDGAASDDLLLLLLLLEDSCDACEVFEVCAAASCTVARVGTTSIVWSLVTVAAYSKVRMPGSSISTDWTYRCAQAVRQLVENPCHRWDGAHKLVHQW